MALRTEVFSEDELRAVPFDETDGYCPACADVLIRTDSGGARCLSCADIGARESHAQLLLRRLANMARSLKPWL